MHCWITFEAKTQISENAPFLTSVRFLKCFYLLTTQIMTQGPEALASPGSLLEAQKYRFSGFTTTYLNMHFNKVPV